MAQAVATRPVAPAVKAENRSDNNNRSLLITGSDCYCLGKYMKQIKSVRLIGHAWTSIWKINASVALDSKEE